MKKKFSIAISLAVILAMTLTSLALAADPTAYVEFKTDAPCPVNVLVFPYTNPANQSGQTAGGSTPWTLPTYPLTSVTFFYDPSVVCYGITYNFVSASVVPPSTSNPPKSGAEGSTTTVTGEYLPDTAAPTLHLPGDITVEATAPTGATVNFLATADDVNPAHPAVTCNPPSGSTFPLGTIPVACSATDAANNTANGSFNVTVVDTTPPTIAPHGDETVEATSALGAVVNYTAPATFDKVDGAGTASCSPASGSTFALGNTTVTCNKTDAHGNVATATTFVVHVVDTGPSVEVPADMTVEATGPSGALVTFSASASDIVDGALTPTCVPGSGSTFTLGTTSVTCSATDTHNNTGSASFSVTVVDTTSPALALPADMTVTALDVTGVVVTFSASANDLVDGPVPVTCTPASGMMFPIGTTTVNCSATDTHNNTGTATFNVTVVMDTTPPVLTLPANMTVDALSASGAVVNFTASANDLVDGPVPVTCSPVSGSLFPLGKTTVNCSATDSHGNSASESFTVTVVDTTPPILTLPSGMVRPALNASGAVVDFTASANDLVDGPVPVTCSPGSGLMFPIGTTAVNCSATDSHGNNARGNFIVSVQYVIGNCNGVPGHQILQPIDPYGSSVFKAGSTVPAKFRVCGTDGVSIGTPGVVSSFRLITIISNGTEMIVDEPVDSTTPDTDFRSGNGQWIFNINTKNLSADNTYFYRITLNDESFITFQFDLK